MDINEVVCPFYGNGGAMGFVLQREIQVSIALCMLQLQYIPVPEWTEDMHSLDKQIRDVYNEQVVRDIALAYAEIPNDVFFAPRYNGGDFGDDLYYAQFYRLV